ncbi:hypothetical protein [Pectinatus brassicae]|uniref:Uncharacterized protein n=1 Tax=Pectinatus brassicae TaxID=862415 RepID=A0A840UXH5_9FIRM|nr:hypothetical protein [Pectinatus brassicae]MBB5337564.1 hypothetical protein [Pectinatus brassicae]
MILEIPKHYKILNKLLPQQYPHHEILKIKINIIGSYEHLDMLIKSPYSKQINLYVLFQAEYDRDTKKEELTHTLTLPPSIILAAAEDINEYEK